MLITIDGLVISRREFGDTSCFIDIFTAEFGVIETAAKGVKRLNSPLSQPTGLFAYSTFCLNKSNLKYNINSAKCKHVFHGLSGDLLSFSLAAYFAELVKFTQLPEQSSGETLKAMLIALTELEHGEQHNKVKSTFEHKLIHALGIAPPDLHPAHSEQYLLEHIGRGFKTLDYFKSLL
jgi:DNA repair protein RecO (recombination protein O)